MSLKCESDVRCSLVLRLYPTAFFSHCGNKSCPVFRTTRGIGLGTRLSEVCTTNVCVYEHVEETLLNGNCISYKGINVL